MIRHTRRASVLIAFCVLTLAATASAECAWVLWTERPTRSDQWSLSGTRRVFETKKECDQAARIGNEVEAKALGAAQKQRRTPVHRVEVKDERVNSFTGVSPLALGTRPSPALEERHATPPARRRQDLRNVSRIC